jgi:RecJ-like exonuclease
MGTITIFTHSDCDGICSGAIALSKFPKAGVFFTKPVSLLEDLIECDGDTIIISDIAIDFKQREQIFNILSKAREVLFFDHHPIPETLEERMRNTFAVFSHNTEVSSSELIYRHFKNKIPKERVWLGLYGAIADYSDNTKFFNEYIKFWDKRTIYFEASVLALGIKNPEFESYDAKRRIVKALASGQNPSDLKDIVESAKTAAKREFELYNDIKDNFQTYSNIAYVKDLPYFGFRGPTALFAATASGKKIGLCIHSRRNHIDVTLRTTSGLILNELAQRAAQTVGGSGGGHPQAAGARIPSDRLRDFLKELDKLMKK